MNALARVVVCSALLGQLTGCATRPTARTPQGPTGLVEISCPIDEARLYVDDHLSASGLMLKDAPLKLSVGAHRLELRAEGHFTIYRDVVITQDATQKLVLSPQPIPAGY